VKRRREDGRRKGNCAERRLLWLLTTISSCPACTHSKLSDCTSLCILLEIQQPVPILELPRLDFNEVLKTSMGRSSRYVLSVLLLMVFPSNASLPVWLLVFDLGNSLAYKKTLLTGQLLIDTSSNTTASAQKRPPIYSVHVHPDSSRIATGGMDSKVRIWSTRPILNEASEKANKPPKMLCTLSMHTGPVLCVRWAYSGRWLASGSDDTVIMIWDLDPCVCLVKECPKSDNESEQAVDAFGAQMTSTSKDGNR
jgi:WD40 repeat protein